MKRSRSGHLGFLGSWRMTPPKKSVTRISTAESEPPGWPDLAAPVISIMSRRICLQMVCKSARGSVWDMRNLNGSTGSPLRHQLGDNLPAHLAELFKSAAVEVRELGVVQAQQA